MTAEVKSKRGFAAMTPERRKEIAAKGGRAGKPENRAFFKDKNLAVEAGAMGGRAVPAEARSFSRDPALAAHAGRKSRGTVEVSPPAEVSSPAKNAP